MVRNKIFTVPYAALMGPRSQLYPNSNSVSAIARSSSWTIFWLVETSSLDSLPRDYLWMYNIQDISYYYTFDILNSKILWR